MSIPLYSSLNCFWPHLFPHLYPNLFIYYFLSSPLRLDVNPFSFFHLLLVCNLPYFPPTLVQLNLYIIYTFFLSAFSSNSHYSLFSTIPIPHHSLDIIFNLLPFLLLTQIPPNISYPPQHLLLLLPIHIIFHIFSFLFLLIQLLLPRIFYRLSFLFLIQLPLYINFHLLLLLLHVQLHLHRIFHLQPFLLLQLIFCIFLLLSPFRMRTNLFLDQTESNRFCA